MSSRIHGLQCAALQLAEQQYPLAALVNPLESCIRYRPWEPVLVQ